VLELVAGAHEGSEGAGRKAAQNDVPKLCRQGPEAERRREAQGPAGLCEQRQREAVLDNGPETAELNRAEWRRAFGAVLPWWCVGRAVEGDSLDVAFARDGAVSDEVTP
jgi:hypothetical protein